MPTLASLGVVIDPSGAQSGGQTVLSILTKMANAADKMASASEAMAKTMGDSAKLGAASLQAVTPVADKLTASVDRVGNEAKNSLGKETVDAAKQAGGTLNATSEKAAALGATLANAGKSGADSLSSIAAQTARSETGLSSLQRQAQQVNEALAEFGDHPPPKIVDTSGTTPTYASTLSARQAEQAVTFEKTLEAVTAAEEQQAAVRASATATTEQRLAAEVALTNAIKANDEAASQLKTTEAAQAAEATRASAPKFVPKATENPHREEFDPDAFWAGMEKQYAPKDDADAERQNAEKEAAARNAQAQAARGVAGRQAGYATSQAAVTGDLASETGTARAKGDVPGAVYAASGAQDAAQRVKEASDSAKEMAQVASEAYKEASDAAKAAATDAAAVEKEAAGDAANAAKEYAATAAQAYKEAAAAAKEAAGQAEGAQKDAATAAATVAKAAAKAEADAAKEQAAAMKQAEQAANTQATALQHNRDSMQQNAESALKAASDHGSLANSLQRSANVLYLFAQAAGPLSGVVTGIATAFNLTGMVMEKFGGNSQAAAEQEKLLSDATQQLKSDQAALATAQGAAADAANALADAQSAQADAFSAAGDAASDEADAQSELVKASSAMATANAVLISTNTSAASSVAERAAAADAAAEATSAFSDAEKEVAAAAAANKAAQQGVVAATTGVSVAGEKAAEAAKKLTEAEEHVAQSAKTVETTTKAAGAAIGSFLAVAGAAVAVLAIPIFAAFTLGATAAGLAWKTLSDAVGKGIAFNEIHSRFSQFVGDAKSAHDAMEELEELGAHSGLGMPELESATQRMLTFGAGLREAMDETRNFALIGAATGKDALAQLENAYITARTEGQISMAQINQLKTAGIDLFSDLAKQTGFTAQQLKHLLGEGIVNFATFKKTIDAATGSGGKFADTFKIRLATPQGQLDQISGHYDELLRHLGEPVAIALVPFLKEADALLHALNPAADTLGQKLRDVLVVITGAAKNGDLGSLLMGAITEGFGKAYDWIKVNFLDPIKKYFDTLTNGTQFGSAFFAVFMNIAALFEKLFKDGGTIIGANISFALDQILEQLSQVLGLGALHNDDHFKTVDERTALPLQLHKEDYDNMVGANNLNYVDSLHKAGVAVKEVTGVLGPLGLSLDLLNRKVAGIDTPKYIPLGRAVSRDELFPPAEPSAPEQPRQPAQHPLTAAELEAIQARQRTSSVNSFIDPFGLSGLGTGGLGLPGQRGRYATTPTAPTDSFNPQAALIRSLLAAPSGPAAAPAAPVANGSGSRPAGQQIVLSSGTLGSMSQADLQAFLAGAGGTATPNPTGKPNFVTLDPATLAALQQPGGIKLEGSDLPLTQQQMANILRDGLIIKQLPTVDPLLNPQTFANMTALSATTAPTTSFARRTPLALNTGVYSGNIAPTLPNTPTELPTVSVGPNGPTNGLFPTGGYSDLSEAARRMYARLPAANFPPLPSTPSGPPPVDTANTQALQTNTAAIQGNTHTLSGASTQFGYVYNSKGEGSVDKTDENRANWDGEAHYGAPIFGRQNIADPSLMGVAISKAQAEEITGIQDWEKAMHALNGVALTVTNTSNGLRQQVVASDVGPGVNSNGKPQIETTGAVAKKLENLSGTGSLTLTLAPGAVLNVDGSTGHPLGSSYDDVVKRARATGEQSQPSAMPNGTPTNGTPPLGADNAASDLKAVQQFLAQVQMLTNAYSGGAMELNEYTRRLNDMRLKAIGSLQNPMGGVTTPQGQVPFTRMINQGYGAQPLSGPSALGQDDPVTRHRAEMQQLEQQQKDADDRMRTNDEGYFNSFVAGMSKAVSSAGTLQQTLGKIGQTVTSDLASGIAGALQSIADGSETAAQAFRKMAASILADIAKMIIEFAILALIKQLAGLAGGAIGGTTGAALQSFANSGVHHTGGIAGSPTVTRMVPSEIFNGANRYHTGGVAGLNPGETPIIAQTGEGIFTQDQMSALAPAGAGQTTNNNSVANQYHSEIHVHQDGTTASSDGKGNNQDAEAMGAALDAKIHAAIIDETTRQGGTIHDYLHGSTRNS